MTRRYRILVVDDDKVIRSLLEEYLSTNYDVLLAEDGLAAWEIIQSQLELIDIVLCDIQMPNLDGTGLLRRIVRRHPGLCVIMTSGTADTRTAVQAIREGAYDYVSKPFADLEEIKFLIDRWAERQTLESKLARYVELHNDMMRNMKLRTFASLDIVKSTLLKVGQNPLLIQHSFLAYHRFVEKLVLKNEGEIYSTAGDGIMASFTVAQCAITSIKEILDNLHSFNVDQNKLAKDFSIRIGVHTGSVIIEGDGKISGMFSSTLDIAAHIQRDAVPNRLEVSRDTLEHLVDRESFENVGREVEGLSIFTAKRKSGI